MEFLDLDKKDKIIFESLVQNSRVSINELVKLTNLAKSSILYRIERLEKNGFIGHYDAIINHNKFLCLKKYIFVKVKLSKKEEFRRFLENNNYCIAAMSLLNNYSHHLFCFFPSNSQFEEFLKEIEIYIEKKLIYNFGHIEFKPYSIFNLNLKNKIKIENRKLLKLDNIDLKIIEYLTNRRSRDSILQISNSINEKYDTVLYRFKRLVKANYFGLFIAQSNPNLLKIQNDIIIIKSDLNFQTLFKKIQKLSSVPYLVHLENNIYSIQLLTKDILDYKNQLNILFEELNDKSELKIIHTKKNLFLNRFNFKYLLNNNSLEK